MEAAPSVEPEPPVELGLLKPVTVALARVAGVAGTVGPDMMKDRSQEEQSVCESLRVSLVAAFAVNSAQAQWEVHRSI